MTGRHSFLDSPHEVSDEVARQRSEIFLPSSEDSLTYHTLQVAAASQMAHLLYPREPEAGRKACNEHHQKKSIPQRRTNDVNDAVQQFPRWDHSVL